MAFVGGGAGFSWFFGVQTPIGYPCRLVDLNRQALLRPLEVSGSVLIQAVKFLGYEKHEQQFQGQDGIEFGIPCRAG